jgi:hypothetical protein
MQFIYCLNAVFKTAYKLRVVLGKLHVVYMPLKKAYKLHINYRGGPAVRIPKKD